MSKEHCSKEEGKSVKSRGPLRNADTWIWYDQYNLELTGVVEIRHKNRKGANWI